MRCTLWEKFGSKFCPRQMSEGSLLIIYKLLHDTLFVSTSFFFLALIAEAILPGIIIAHVGFSKIVIFVLLNILLLGILEKRISPEKIKAAPEMKKGSRLKIGLPLTIIGAVLLYIAQSGMNVWLNLFIVACYGLIGYLAYRLLFIED